MGGWGDSAQGSEASRQDGGGLFPDTYIRKAPPAPTHQAPEIELKQTKRMAMQEQSAAVAELGKICAGLAAYTTLTDRHQVARRRGLLVEPALMPKCQT